MAAHRQAARGLDEEQGYVAILAKRRVEDGAGHDVVAARLEHQGVPHPIVLRQEVLAALEHGGALEPRNRAPRHHPDRVAAGVAVDAKKRRAHGPSLTGRREPCHATRASWQPPGSLLAAPRSLK